MGKARFVDVWLVRAGCTQWDQEGRIVGATDLPSCQAGLESARQAATTLSHHSIAAVVTGPSEACRTTSTLIAEATQAKVRELEALGEIGLGLWEGTLACDIEDRCPTAYRQWKSDPSSVIPPEGEAYEDAVERVAGAAQAAIKKYHRAGQGLAIVVGPTIFGLLKCWFEKRPPSDLWQLVENDPSLQRLTVNSDTMATVAAATASREAQGSLSSPVGLGRSRLNLGRA